LTAGIWARLIALQRMSCRSCDDDDDAWNRFCNRTLLFRMGGSQALHPSLWATATLTAYYYHF